jgi:hypothetical protein
MGRIMRQPMGVLAMFSDVKTASHVSVVASGSYSDRMAAQQGLFTLSTQISDDHADVIGCSLHNVIGLVESFKIIIPSGLKADFLRRLRSMNISARSLFPGADGLGRSLAEFVRVAYFGI